MWVLNSFAHKKKICSLFVSGHRCRERGIWGEGGEAGRQKDRQREFSRVLSQDFFIACKYGLISSDHGYRERGTGRDRGKRQTARVLEGPVSRPSLLFANNSGLISSGHGQPTHDSPCWKLRRCWRCIPRSFSRSGPHSNT